MQYQLQIFEYQDRVQIRTVEIDGAVWFYAQDACRALEIVNPGNAYARLEEDDIRSLDAKSKKPTKTNPYIISEYGLYDLILQSRKESARQFKRWIIREVLPQIRRTGGYGIRQGTPAFVRRFNDNWDRVESGYFSVISELFIRVYGRFEQVGYLMPDKGDTGQEMRPDVSVGRLFSAWLNAHHPHLADAYTSYMHKLPDGMEVPARQYRLEVLPIFVQYVDGVWLPERAPGYLQERDRKALSYLPKLLPAPITVWVRV